MQETAPPTTPAKQRQPILARHAISLAVVFALALPLSFVVGKRIYREIKLDKLTAVDELEYAQGYHYVKDHVREDDHVLDRAIAASSTIESRRAGELLVAVSEAYLEAGVPIPDSVVEAFVPLIQRVDSGQAIVVFDWMLENDLAPRERLAQMLMRNYQTDSEDAVFLTTVELLDTRFLWTKRLADRDQWIRWLSLMAQASDELSQRKAARLLGALPDNLDDPRIAQTLSTLAQSRHAAVRMQVLDVTAGYAASADDPTGYEQVIFDLGGDEDPQIARRAWLVVGHLNPLSGFAVDWADANPRVAETMLWAVAKTNPDSAPLVFEAYDNGLALEAAHAIYALPFPPTANGLGPKWQRIHDLLGASPQSLDDVLVMWRYLPNMQLDWQWHDLYSRTDAFPKLFATLGRDAIWQGPSAGIIHALVYYARIGYEPAESTPQETGLLAAWIEGLEAGPPTGLREQPVPIYFEAQNEASSEALALNYGSLDFVPVHYTYLHPATPTILASVGDLPGPIPDLTLLSDDPAAADLWVAIMFGDHGTDPGQAVVADVESYLRSYETHIQTTAALYAGMAGLRPRLISGASADFLRANPDIVLGDLREMSDQELVALGLERVDALSAMLDIIASTPPTPESRKTVKLLQLALWMRGDLGDDFTPTAEAMLLDDSLSTSTVLMCLLHKQRPIALKYLFGDLVTPRPDLQQLFIYQRWWHVYRRLVDTSDTPLWLWGDPGAHAFQYDSMRQWYAVNRWRLEEGWWPEVIKD